MRKYECTFIINPEKEEESKQITEEIKAYFEKNKAKIKKVDEWGIKELAYEIDGHDKGFYTVINFEADPEKINNLKEFMRQNNNILRHILVVKEK
ncbi:30S ribosomal protein S6 [candidate division WOR-3 bacterium]|nr:30S ribosomal protein S6 [candidate division WOR-3 bacterium]